MKTIKKHVKWNFILLFLIAGFSASLNAITIDVTGKVKITGKIMDATSKAPMEYVSVVLYSQNDSSLLLGTISQKDGNFSISGLQPGKYYLEFSFIGYEKRKVSPVEIDLKTNHLELGEVVLLPVLAEINEVLVTGTRTNVEYKIDKKVVRKNRHTLLH